MKFDGEKVANYLAVGIPSLSDVGIPAWTTVGSMMSVIALVKAHRTDLTLCDFMDWSKFNFISIFTGKIKKFITK